MRRHPALVALSRDHHHGLVHAQRLRRASGARAAARLDAASEFLDFFAHATAPHFEGEERVLFPLLLEHAWPAPDPLARALVEHARIRALVARLRRAVASERVEGQGLADLGESLAAHIRLEERQLFPLIEEVVPEEALAGVDLSGAEGPDEPVAVDLAAGRGSGPLWGTASEDLNATLLAWGPGEGVVEHVNEERDVLLVVSEGSGAIWVDGARRDLAPAEAILIEKGRSRRIVAGDEGLRYLSIHVRRPPLQLADRRSAR